MKQLTDGQCIKIGRFFEGIIGEMIKGSDLIETPSESVGNVIDVAREYLDLDEVDDKAALMELFAEADISIDPEDTSWCAAFVNAVLAKCGIEGTGSLRARDFMNWGVECEEEAEAVVVYKSHVGFVSSPGRVLGGNQTNAVLDHPQTAYRNKLGYRKPA